MIAVGLGCRHEATLPGESFGTRATPNQGIGREMSRWDGGGQTVNIGCWQCAGDEKERRWTPRWDFFFPAPRSCFGDAMDAHRRGDGVAATWPIQVGCPLQFFFWQWHAADRGGMRLWEWTRWQCERGVVFPLLAPRWKWIPIHTTPSPPEPESRGTGASGTGTGMAPCCPGLSFGGP